MEISCKFGDANWCSFPLRVLNLKISLRAAPAQRKLKQSIQRMHPVDTINILIFTGSPVYMKVIAMVVSLLGETVNLELAP